MQDRRKRRVSFLKLGGISKKKEGGVRRSFATGQKSSCRSLEAQTERRFRLRSPRGFQDLVLTACWGAREKAESEHGLEAELVGGVWGRGQEVWLFLFRREPNSLSRAVGGHDQYTKFRGHRLPPPWVL